MAFEADIVSRLRQSWQSGIEGAEGADYRLLTDLGGSFAARTQAGQVALLVPLPDMPSVAVGRRAAGCELLPHGSIRIAHDGRAWSAPAAALVCLDPELLESFAVLAADIVARASSNSQTWASIVDIVDQWQALLAPNGRPSAEAEIGLWGELWFIAGASEIGHLLAGWRGPERDMADFFLDGVAVEIKTSRTDKQHHVSFAQVTSPVGSYPAWLLSLWVKEDPRSTLTVPVLADRIMERAPRPIEALRRMAQAGYKPADHAQFQTHYALLDEPAWFDMAQVPRIHGMDSGVSQVRYRMTLDERHQANTSVADGLWRHFLGHDYGGFQDEIS
jgi:hypothetical protein